MSRARGDQNDFRRYAAGILTEVAFIIGIFAAAIAIIFILRLMIG